ncbi:Alpha-D-glucose 1-phosphate phosphatase YihX [Streptomyces sp. RB17]|uniref:HAD family hydrolase n=1 Tax=Streptomyces sp. RB17 TaxID=2585197 RepID=UPI001296055D|nr:HAD family phosphatase [Streptomyces sp. RB17]MQY37442.1 Alpha-D-glucose 1-phosphate phosphatase YihX [Streptomyces sp. RB17]
MDLFGQGADTSPGTRSAVLFDFGGVLTTSVFAAFEQLGADLGCDPRLPLRLLARDRASGALLVAHEEGRIGELQFEQGFAERLRAHGVAVDRTEPGIVRRLQSAMGPDRAMIDLVARVREAGYRVGLLSNSLGDDCYAGFDLPAMFDAVTVSGEVGVRKPSRRAYEIACERLGVHPRDAVMVDDLEQNVAAAERAGLAGVVHTHAAATAAALTSVLRPPARTR